jgi:cytochrome c oxidase cbb3-type subunit 4
VSYEVYGPYLPLIMLITFVALFVWVAHPKNSKKFDEAAQAPFADEDEVEKRSREQSEGAQATNANNGRNDK